MSAPLTIEIGPGGLHLPALDLHLDPPAHRRVARAFVSHAHGDHTASARSDSADEILASPETLALVAARRGTAIPGARPVGWDEAVELPIARAHGGGTARLGIRPAGHVLGAAQLVVDHPGGRLVYTGDYRTGPGATHAEGAPVACDQLLIESTFALPIFRFPDRDRVRADLVAWCRARLDEGALPVVMAYAMGKAQGVVSDLLAASLPVVAHGAVHAVCAAYEALGVPLGVADGRLRPYASGKKRTVDGVLVVPPRAASQMAKKRGNAMLAWVSGWALLDAPLEQHRADAGFVLSDHADHPDLVRTVVATGARRVVTTHGNAEAFARILRDRGIDAAALPVPPLDQTEDDA